MGEIVEITKQLIEFKTTSENPEELKKCIDFIEDYFKDMELFVHRFNSKKKPSVAVTLQDTKNPELFLAAHCDVVPADDSEFVPEEKDGRLYGRGAIDNKASVAICMRLMKYYSQQNNKPNIGVMFTTDEEIGGKEGVNLLLNNEGYSCKFAIVMDGGENYNIVHRHKGSLHIKMVARGKGTHGSRPWEGDNAIEKLLDFYSELKTHFPKVEQTDLWKRTINLGKISGGTTPNQVPDYAEVWIDMRFISDKEKQEILDIILDMAKNQKIESEVLSDANMLHTQTDSKFVQSLKKSVESVVGAASFSSEHGSTDAKYFAEKNIPAVLLLPLGKNEHTKGEYVEIQSMDHIYNMLKDFIDNNISKSD